MVFYYSIYFCKIRFILEADNKMFFYKKFLKKEFVMSLTRIGAIKEIKDNENRVGLTPDGVSHLISGGHSVVIESRAGEGSGYSDKKYASAGAYVVSSAEEVVTRIDILVKIKEILPEEYPLLKLLRGKVLYTYLHLAGCEKALTEQLLVNNITAIAYETVEDKNGRHPLLMPMSRIAGIQSIAYASQFLQKQYGGKGVTLGSVMGARPSHTVVVGGGIAGTCAAATALGMGGKVTLFEKRSDRMLELGKIFNKQEVGKLYKNIEIVCPYEPFYSNCIAACDVLIGAVSVGGAHAPCVVSEEHLKNMEKGSVIVDIAIDQGGCTAWSKATSHSNPIFVREGLVFCCIANIPGQVPRQATDALTSVTLPHLLEISDIGVEEMLKAHPHFRRGLNTFDGKVTCGSVAEFHGMLDRYEDVEKIFG